MSADTASGMSADTYRQMEYIRSLVEGGEGAGKDSPLHGRSGGGVGGGGGGFGGVGGVGGGVGVGGGGGGGVGASASGLSRLEKRLAAQANGPALLGSPPVGPKQEASAGKKASAVRISAPSLLWWHCREARVPASSKAQGG